ncbi:MAG: AAA family ATPase [Bacteroidales bacterium]|nr:AAA family ATPase [Bacteroidales bacterium]
MSSRQQIRLDLWPVHDNAQESGRAVPYLDINGVDDPIDFLFTLGGKYGLIARANLHTLQGQKKAGKSAAGLALIVAAIKGEFIGITPSRENLAVLWIDTEQDKNTLRQKAKAVLSMAGRETMPESLKIVTLRGYGSPADALAATLQAIAENAADFVFLDGVVDLCQAFNDEEKSRAVVRQLEAHAEKYGAAILGLIHTNKYNDEARGHLGAIMQQKSAEIYQVNKEGNTAQVTQPFSRFAPVPPFSFTFADDFKIAAPAEGNTDLERFAALNKAFAPLFADAQRLTAGELVAAYMDYYQKSKRTAQDAIKAATFARVLDRQIDGRRVYYCLPFQDINAEDDI